MITLYPLTCTLKLQFHSDGVTLSKEDLEALKQSFPFATSVVRYGYKERHVYLLGARLVIRLPKVKVNFCNPVTDTTWHKYHEIIPVFILPHIRYACLTLLLVALSLFGIAACLGIWLFGKKIKLDNTVYVVFRVVAIVAGAAVLAGIYIYPVLVNCFGKKR